MAAPTNAEIRKANEEFWANYQLENQPKYPATSNLTQLAGIRAEIDARPAPVKSAKQIEHAHRCRAQAWINWRITKPDCPPGLKNLARAQDFRCAVCRDYPRLGFILDGSRLLCRGCFAGC